MERRVAVVVEDDEDIRGLMVALLGQSGFEVHEAATGTAGVEAAQRHDPTVITVDLGLPDIDGYEVTRRVRQFTDAYVVMLTARTEEIDTLLGLEAGADDYLTKPFRPRELRARIEAMLRRPRTASTAPAQPAVGPASPVPSSVPPGASAVPRGDLASSARADGPGPQPGAGDPAPMPADAAASTRLALDGLELFPHLHEVVPEGREIAVTPTEFQLLETLMRSGRVVRSKEELARTLRGEEPDSGTFVSQADERTVEVHVGNLRRKLADAPRAPRWVDTV